jgi:hypothetical protein
MSLEDPLRIARQMDRKSDFSRVKVDTVHSKHLGAQDIRFQDDPVLVEPDHSNWRQVEVAEISGLQLLRLDAASPWFFVLGFELCTVKAKFLEGISQSCRSYGLLCLKMGSPQDLLRSTPQPVKVPYRTDCNHRISSRFRRRSAKHVAPTSTSSFTNCDDDS